MYTPDFPPPPLSLPPSLSPSLSLTYPQSNTVERCRSWMTRGRTMTLDPVRLRGLAPTTTCARGTTTSPTGARRGRSLYRKTLCPRRESAGLEAVWSSRGKEWSVWWHELFECYTSLFVIFPIFLCVGMGWFSVDRQTCHFTLFACLTFLLYSCRYI